MAHVRAELEDAVVALSVRKLARLWNPYRVALWTTEALTRAGVTRCIKKGLLKGTPYDGMNDYRTWTLEDHAARVAYLVVNGWSDPIEIDVGVPVLNYEPDWPVIDGNHRLAAAIYRKDETINVSASGQVNVIWSLQPAGSVPFR